MTLCGLKLQQEELTNKNLNFDVEKKNRELVSKVNFISQRNEYLRSLKRKISSSSSNESLTLFKVNKQLDLVLKSENAYDEFDNVFVNDGGERVRKGRAGYSMARKRFLNGL